MSVPISRVAEILRELKYEKPGNEYWCEVLDDGSLAFLSYDRFGEKLLFSATQENLDVDYVHYRRNKNE